QGEGEEDEAENEALPACIELGKGQLGYLPARQYDPPRGSGRTASSHRGEPKEDLASRDPRPGVSCLAARLGFVQIMDGDRRQGTSGWNGHHDPAILIDDPQVPSDAPEGELEERRVI